jgi:hypothetical protein
MSGGTGKSLALLGIGALLGVLIWMLSPWLTGKAEPWDAEAPIWLVSWLLVAVVGGAIGHVRGICLPVGYALGQMLITAQSAIKGEFGVLGWMFIAAYAAVGACISLMLIGLVEFGRSLIR